MSDQTVLLPKWYTPREGGSFWQKDSFVTLILFELHMPLMIFSPVTNFGDHPLCTPNVFKARELMN